MPPRGDAALANEFVCRQPEERTGACQSSVGYRLPRPEHKFPLARSDSRPSRRAPRRWPRLRRLRFPTARSPQQHQFAYRKLPGVNFQFAPMKLCHGVRPHPDAMGAVRNGILVTTPNVGLVETVRQSRDCGRGRRPGITFASMAFSSATRCRPRRSPRRYASHPPLPAFAMSAVYRRTA